MAQRRDRPLRHLPLYSHLLLLVVGTVLPVLIFTSGLVWRLVRDNRSAMERRVLQSARAQGSVVDRELAATVRTLQALAASERLDSADLEGFDKEVRRSIKTQPAWSTLLLLDPEGRVLVDTARPFGAAAAGASAPEDLPEVRRTGQPVVGRLGRGAAGLAFPVHVPVLREGRIRYVLTAMLTPEALTNIVARQLPPSEEWTRGIVDARGTVVARTTPGSAVGQPARPSFLERIKTSSEAVYHSQTLEGHPVYVAFSRAPLFGWTTSVVVPVGVLDAPFRRSLSALAGVGFLVLTLSAGGAFLLSRRISSDLRAAAAAAEALAKGEQPRLSTSVVSEVMRLRDSLSHSSQLLQEREHERDDHLARAEAARVEAEEASRTKDEFLAMIGHELRNPLAPIVTALHLLKLRGDSGSREHAIIGRQVQHMVRLVDDLLDVSRITRGMIDLKKEGVTVQAIVAKAVEMSSPVFEERRHHLEVALASPDLSVNGDPARLAQVVTNLMVNAAKYTAPGGQISVAARREGSAVAIEVKDNGQGLSAELLPRVFEPFVQGPRASDRREGGLGLGLAIIHNLVMLHGGSVEARSEGPGQGSTFIVRLPAVEVAPPAAADAIAPPAALPARGQVLVVDDNSDAAHLLAELLRACGLEVEIALDGPGALVLLDRFHPEIAVLDIGLPLMDGYELAARIRARLGEAAPVFIAVTGYGQEQDAARSRGAGFRHHFVKPVDGGALLDVINALAKNRGVSSKVL